MASSASLAFMSVEERIPPPQEASPEHFTSIRMPSVRVRGPTPPLAPERFRSVAYYLPRIGFDVIPVKTRYERILIRKSYPDVKSVPDPPEVVDVFATGGLLVGAKSIWLQFGVVNEAEAKSAKTGGLIVVIDRYMKIEHGRLGGSLHSAGMIGRLYHDAPKPARPFGP